jgi:hypothetical protein
MQQRPIARAPDCRRIRLHRERRQRGLRCLMIQLRETDVDALIRRGLLEQETRNDSKTWKIMLSPYMNFII